MTRESGERSEELHSGRAFFYSKQPLIYVTTAEPELLQYTVDPPIWLALNCNLSFSAAQAQPTVDRVRKDPWACKDLSFVRFT